MGDECKILANVGGHKMQHFASRRITVVLHEVHDNMST